MTEYEISVVFTAIKEANNEQEALQELLDAPIGMYVNVGDIEWSVIDNG